MKAIAHQVKIVLPCLFTENQYAFVPNHKMHNNALIEFELLHSLSQRKRGKKMVFALKSDMNKVYN